MSMMISMEATQSRNQAGRDDLANWQVTLQQNSYTSDRDLLHTIHYYFPDASLPIHQELTQFGEAITAQLEPLVTENNQLSNLPQLEPYDGIGNPLNKVVHHEVYTQVGDVIYSTQLMAKMAKPGGLLAGLSLFFLSSEAGEAGHNCPIACSAGIIRVFSKVADFPNKTFYLEKLLAPSYQTNFTGAQFLTEVQGGCDVGENATYAEQHNSVWRIYGEKWFCSNANADLIFITARFDKKTPGTKGLGLFLIPTLWDGQHNHFTIRRLKEKLGTRSMATAEIDFQGAYAYPMGEPTDGFKLVMENVLHISRLFNSFTVIGMARRAHAIAKSYAEHRIAFAKPIIDYPLACVKYYAFLPSFHKQWHRAKGEE